MTDLTAEVSRLARTVIGMKAKELWTRQHGVIIHRQIPVGEIAKHTGFTVLEVDAALFNDPCFDRFVAKTDDGYAVSYAYTMRGYEIG